MTKLFSLDEKKEVVTKAPVYEVSLQNLSKDIDKDLITLENHVEAYSSVNTITSSPSFESFDFVNGNNAILFNEYLKGIQRNLKIPVAGYLATERINEGTIELKTYQLSLEGIISNIWEATKRMFRKIGSSISEFFRRRFTSLGIAERRLENLIKVLEKTKAELQEVEHEKVPGKVKTTFPVKGRVSSSDLDNGISLVDDILDAVDIINKNSEDVAKKSILDSNTVAVLKGLRDKVELANKEKGEDPGMINFSKKAKAQKANYEKNTDIAEKAQKQADDLSASVSELGDKAPVNEDEGLANARKELAAYFAGIQPSLKKLEKRVMPNGKVIKEVKFDWKADNADSEPKIEIEIDTVDDEPTSIALGSRSKCLNLCKVSLDQLKKMKNTTKSFPKVNDIVQDQLDKVDRLIKDLDKLDESGAQSYKKLLQNQVKARLNIMKNFYTAYNQLNKNFMEYTIDTAEGVIVYSTESLKRFK